MTYLTDHAQHRRACFRVIEGTCGEEAFRSARRARAARPVHADVGPSELAAEMAVIYALSLLREVPLAELENPHFNLRIDAQTSFSLHEMLCELRSLPWLDRHSIPYLAPRAEGSSTLTAGTEEIERRASRWNDDGQLTLRMLLRGMTHGDTRGPLLSQLLPGLASSQPGTDGSGLDAAFEAMPSQRASVLTWQNWLDANREQAKALSGQAPETLCDLAALGHLASPGRAAFALALSMAAKDMAPVSALSGRGWAGAELMALIAEAVSLSTQAARAQAAQADRLRRPAVLAARISLMTGREDPAGNASEGVARQVLEELRRFAPRLLMWVHSRNGADGSGAISVADEQDTDPRMSPAMRMRENLMLPMTLRDDLPLHPSDAQAQGTVAGACVTILKAVYAGPFSGPSGHSRAGTGGPTNNMMPRRPGLSADLDKLASNVVLGRLVTGGYFHFENLNALRKGERIAIALLSELVETREAQGDLGFFSFDRKCVRISARPQSNGVLRAEVLVDGCPVSDLSVPGNHRPTLRAV